MIFYLPEKNKSKEEESASWKSEFDGLTKVEFKDVFPFQLWFLAYSSFLVLFVLKFYICISQGKKNPFPSHFQIMGTWIYILFFCTWEDILFCCLTKRGRSGWMDISVSTRDTNCSLQSTIFSIAPEHLLP